MTALLTSCPAPESCRWPDKPPVCGYLRCVTPPTSIMVPAKPGTRHNHWCGKHLGPAVEGQKYGNPIESSPEVIPLRAAVAARSKRTAR